MENLGAEAEAEATWAVRQLESAYARQKRTQENLRPAMSSSGWIAGYGERINESAKHRLFLVQSTDRRNLALGEAEVTVLHRGAGQCTSMQI